MSKSPFEIRLEILKMTAELMQAEYEANLEFAQEAFEGITNKATDSREMLDKFMPKPFDFGEVLEKSKKFYEFVNAK
jgi:hypothetical protein